MILDLIKILSAWTYLLIEIDPIFAGLSSKCGFGKFSCKVFVKNPQRDFCTRKWDLEMGFFQEVSLIWNQSG